MKGKYNVAKMKIGLDISQTAFIGGVSEYTKRLAEGLSKRPDLEIVFFYSSLRRPYRGNLKGVKKVLLPPSALEPLLNKLRTPIEFFIGDVDVFHSSDWTQPKTTAKKVTTYHDVIPLKHPEWSTSLVVEVHKRRLALVEKEIDKVIAVSQSTKNELLEVSKIPADKVVVIYEGVDEIFKPQPTETIEAFRQKLKLPKHFVLAIGGVGDRRNLSRLKEAAKGFDLIITGETIPWVLDAERPLLYGAADLLCYPSLYEGFGLPVLEAMACGTAVLTSNTGALPEVGGRAAEYVDPFKVEDIRKKLAELMKNPEKRATLGKQGIQQAAKFTWQNCIDQTVDLYKSLVDR